MALEASVTIIKMLEAIPKQLQDRVLEHMRDYIEDLQDEARWSKTFSRTQGKLVAAARRARQETAEGKAVQMNLKKL